MINHPELILITIIGLKLFRFLPDRIFLKLLFRLNLGRRLNLKNPVSFNEKLQWLKIFDNNPLYIKLADKYEVRKYVSEKVGDNYLIPLIGVYDHFDDIEFDHLPESFVMKCTHDSGSVIVVKDKNKFNYCQARSMINKKLRTNYFYKGREWPYKYIKPRIICEKLMVDEPGQELKDYKIFCFNGEPLFIQIDYNRFKNHKRNLFNIEWDPINVSYAYPREFNTSNDKPSNWDDMLICAKKLSQETVFARTDFYSIQNEIYFGEITFFPESGFGRFMPDSYDYIFGKILDLNKNINV